MDLSQALSVIVRFFYYFFLFSIWLLFRKRLEHFQILRTEEATQVESSSANNVSKLDYLKKKISAGLYSTAEISPEIVTSWQKSEKLFFLSSTEHEHISSYTILFSAFQIWKWILGINNVNQRAQLLSKHKIRAR